jgi:glucose 1-dehydrogenase
MSPTTARLDGKVALVTGADSGIGQAIAIEFAKDGADVAVVYFSDREGAIATRDAIEQHGRRAAVMQADLSKEEEVEALFDDALDQLSALDILVNNAGVPGAGSMLVDMSTEDWDRTLRTNLYGYFFCCRRFLRIRKSSGGGGKIINISSVHDEIPRAGMADYDCTKSAIQALTRTLALEVAPDKINVNSIGPGMVLTPINQEAMDDPKVYEEAVRNIPLKRAGRPEEVAWLAVYLASSQADYVTGATFYIDGGLMQNMGQGA